MLDRTAIAELSASYHTERALNPRNNSYLRASGIGSCRRQLAYRLQWYREGREELPIWTHGLFTFDLGHGIHYRLQSRLSNVGPLQWVDAEPYIDQGGQLAWHGNCEIPLKDDEYRVAGHCDALTRPLKKVTRRVEGEPVELYQITGADDPEGRRYVIDIKSITARERLKLEHDPMTGSLRNCQVLPSAFEKLKAPKDEHISQVSLYAWMMTRSGFQTEREPQPLAELPGLMIIYVAKDLDPAFYGNKPEDYSTARHLLNSPYKVFTVEPNPKHIEVLLRKAAGVWKAADEGTLPSRDYHHKPERPAYQCVDCAFRQECYSDEGYFRDDDLSLPPLIKYRTGQIDPALITLG